MVLNVPINIGGLQHTSLSLMFHVSYFDLNPIILITTLVIHFTV
jgi:hypothetical protein